MIPLLALLLACPGSVRLDDTPIGAPADTADTSPAETADTADTSPAETADTADTSPAETAPALLDLEVSEDDGAIVVAFTSAGDVAQVRVDVAGVAELYDVAQLDDWTGTSGTVRVPFDDCDRGTTVLVEVALVAGDGRQSESETSGLVLSGLGVRVDESGDTSAEAVDLGTIGSVYVCGSVYAATGDRFYQGSDLDWLAFSVDHAGSWSASLTWTEPDGDYDVGVRTVATTEIDGHSTADDHTGRQPEEVLVDLDAGDYFVFVAGYAGAVGDYRLVLIEAP